MKDEARFFHAYVETNPYKGCGQCGVGPGALVHNDAVRRHEGDGAPIAPLVGPGLHEGHLMLNIALNTTSNQTTGFSTADFRLQLLVGGRVVVINMTEQSRSEARAVAHVLRSVADEIERLERR